jgi:two-component system, NarL family, sensor kinase
VAAFAALGLAAIVAVAVIASLAIRDITNNEAMREAKQLTRIAALSAITPDLTDQVVSGNPTALARMDRTVRTRVLRTPVVRVKLWTLDGRIVYSDAHALIGHQFALDAGQRRAVRTGAVASDVSDAHGPENVLDRGFGKLLEVYLRVRTPDGQPLLYEEYLRYGAIADNSRRQWLDLFPAFGGALLILALAQLPLAYWLARRLRQRESEREALLVHLVESSDRERRRLAQAVHEGPVQALAGVAWRLSAAARKAPPPLQHELEESAADARQAQRELRSILVSLHPPNLTRVGLHDALADAAAPLRDAGVEVRLDVPAMDLPPDAQVLVYRVAEEGLRNAHRHADATHVEVSLRSENGHTRLRVDDDGEGFSEDQLAGRQADGHRGLALLRDLAADAGGDLSICSSPGHGTTIELVL